MSSREVDLVNRLKNGWFSLHLQAIFKPAKSKRDEDQRLYNGEKAEGGLERQRQTDNWRIELSSGYIWGLCDS